MKYSDYIKPMLTRLAEKPFDGKDWIFEIKWDGYRAIAHTGRNGTKLYSRNGLSFQNDYPEIFEAARNFPVSAILDGEIVALDPKSRPSFQLLQLYKTDPSVTLIYYVFDILQLEQKDLKPLPLIERKEILRDLLNKYRNPIIRYSDHVEETGKKFFDLVAKKGLEGMIAKQASSPYLIGKRSDYWRKIKYTQGQEVIIAGYTAPRGSRKYFGALILGVYRGGKLRYTGHAGAGFSEKTLEELYKKMKPLETTQKPFEELVKANAPVTWLKPKLVANVKFSEWTRDNIMRHPVFLGLRKDKQAKEVVMELPS